MDENVNYKEVSDLICDGKVLKSIDAYAKKAFSLLGAISASQKFEIQNLIQWSKLLSGRHKRLQEMNVDFGGIEESISALAGYNGRVSLITLESDLYVSMFLLSKEEECLVGAFYIERDQDTGGK